MFAGFLVRRILGALLVVFVVSFGVFAIFFMTPGIDPARLMAGDSATPATLAVVRERFGLNEPWYVQYLTMMRKLFITQDLTSFSNQGLEVIPQLLRALPVTVSLGIGAMVLWMAVAVPLGIVGAYTRRRWVDTLISVTSMATLAIPTLWLATLMLLLSQGPLHNTWLFSWVPSPGYTGFSEDPLEWAARLVIPWFVLGLHYIGLYARLLRASLLETEGEDYMRTARGKGLPERRVILRHSLRTSSSSVMSVFAMDVGALIGGGSFVVEVIFGLPGVGLLLYKSLQRLDVPVILAAAIYSAILIVLVNLVIDIVNSRLDPRVALS